MPNTNDPCGFAAYIRELAYGEDQEAAEMAAFEAEVAGEKEALAQLKFDAETIPVLDGEGYIVGWRQAGR